jgi:hypothetical protein
MGWKFPNFKIIPMTKEAWCHSKKGEHFGSLVAIVVA